MCAALHPFAPIPRLERAILASKAGDAEPSVGARELGRQCLPMPGQTLLRQIQGFCWHISAGMPGLLSQLRRNGHSLCMVPCVLAVDTRLSYGSL